MSEVNKRLDKLRETDEMPRRCQLDKNTPAELAIYKAMQEVEKLGADIKLTAVSEMLLKAKIKLADFIDEQ